MRMRNSAGLELTPAIVHWRATETVKRRLARGRLCWEDRHYAYQSEYERLTTFDGVPHVWVHGVGWEPHDVEA